VVVAMEVSTMNGLKLAALAAALAVTVPSTVSADSYWEVEAARANARAGGPTNARDAELLERYGCLSGTYASRLCQRLSHGDSGNYHRRYYKRRPRGR
jgi:hypothetical protein